jgi:hypothetical protein
MMFGKQKAKAESLKRDASLKEDSKSEIDSERPTEVTSENTTKKEDDEPEAIDLSSEGSQKSKPASRSSAKPTSSFVNAKSDPATPVKVGHQLSLILGP